jgi:hypothetical protein
LAAKKSSGGSPPASAPVAPTSAASSPAANSPVAERPAGLGKPQASTSQVAPDQSLTRLKQFYLTEVRRYLNERVKTSPLADEEAARRLFFQWRSELPVEMHELLKHIEGSCDERRRLLHLERLHWQLHWWLGIHVPASIAVVILMLIHIVVALRVVPF